MRSPTPTPAASSPRAASPTPQHTWAPRPVTGPPIGLGRDGKPFYFSDPYDNQRTVVQTLERACGTGNYGYVAHL